MPKCNGTHPQYQMYKGGIFFVPWEFFSIDRVQLVIYDYVFVFWLETFLILLVCEMILTEIKHSTNQIV